MSRSETKETFEVGQEGDRIMANPNYQDRNSERVKIFCIYYTLIGSAILLMIFIAILYEYLQDQWMSCFGSCLIG